MHLFNQHNMLEKKLNIIGILILLFENKKHHHINGE